MPGLLLLVWLALQLVLLLLINIMCQRGLCWGLGSCTCCVFTGSCQRWLAWRCRLG
jgi:hypothetical protein